jgi:hypothetical protein
VKGDFMKYCHKCQVHVSEPTPLCPLCQSTLSDDKIQATEPLFPLVAPPSKSYYSVLQIVAFISIVLCSLSILFSIVFSLSMWVWVLTIAIVAGIWSSLANAIFKYKNILKCLLYQSFILILLSLFVDFLFGFKGWSITFVIPILFTLDMVVMYTLSKILKLQPGDYIIYLLIDAFFGILPIIFVGADSVLIDLPSVVCSITSIVSIAALIAFEGPTMLHELKRRLHI